MDSLRGNNIWMRFTLGIFDPDYILLLNKNTIVDERFLSELTKIAETDDRIRIVEPLIYYHSKSNRV